MTLGFIPVIFIKIRIAGCRTGVPDSCHYVGGRCPHLPLCEKMVVPPHINFLYTNIGRGHPFYLDGILEALVRRGNIKLVKSESDVFDVSRGLSRFAWQAARWMYRKGSSPGIVAAMYKKLRSSADYNRPGAILRLMGRDLRRRFSLDPNPVVVAHPTLVAILKGRHGLIYQHGELVTPTEEVVAGASKVLVPTDGAAAPFIDFGYDSRDVVVTGLCIEPSLVRQAGDAFAARLKRVGGDNPLIGTFFSSGAEPRRHIEKLVRAAASAASHGGKALLFAQRDGLLANQAARGFTMKGIEFGSVDSRQFLPADLPPALIVQYASRREENGFMAQLFPMFDYLVAPSHERTNWALGLGLPMFVVGPQIGPFAPLNCELLVHAGVAEQIDSNSAADAFGERLNHLRATGKLVEMAKAGWGKYRIDGFDKIAEFLITDFAG